MQRGGYYAIATDSQASRAQVIIPRGRSCSFAGDVLQQNHSRDDMNSSPHFRIIGEMRNHAIALNGQSTDYTPLLDMIGDAKYVLIGEATHGTDEFYRIRADITKQLIRYYGFSAVAVEADWPDAYRANRYVRGGDRHIRRRQGRARVLGGGPGRGLRPAPRGRRIEVRVEVGDGPVRRRQGARIPAVGCGEPTWRANVRRYGDGPPRAPVHICDGQAGARVRRGARGVRRCDGGE